MSHAFQEKENIKYQDNFIVECQRIKINCSKKLNSVILVEPHENPQFCNIQATLCNSSQPMSGCIYFWGKKKKKINKKGTRMQEWLLFKKRL